MSNQKAPKLQEFELDEYVAARIQQTNLPITAADFLVAAFEQRSRIQHAADLASLCACIGIGFMLWALPAWYFGLPKSPMLLATAALLTALGFMFCRAGFDGKNWQNVLTLTGMQSLEFPLVSEFRAVVEPVLSGEHQVFEIDQTGIGVFNTPVSNQPVTKTYGAQALNDLRFPATLFEAEATSARKFIIVTPVATGDWFNFFVWNEPVASHIADLFDNTPDIYKGETIKRLKARVALCTIANFVVEQKQLGRKFNSKDTVVTQFQTALKLEATTQRQANKITDVEERQLCRLNITGAAPTEEVEEIEKRKSPKPESWFLNMMSGDYDPILRPLAQTIKAKNGELPTFVAG